MYWGLEGRIPIAREQIQYPALRHIVPILVVGLVADLHLALAQQPDTLPVQVGEHIRLNSKRVTRLNEWYFDGYFVGLTSGDSIVLNSSRARWDDSSGAFPDDITMATSDIKAMEARRCCASGLGGFLSGASIGTLAGIAAGVIGVGVGCATEHLNCHAVRFETDAILFTLGRGAIGAAIGGIIGALRPPKKWREVQIPTGPKATPRRRE